MLITTLHETIFQYDRAIRGTFTEARLWPVSDEGQTCRAFSLSVDPLRSLSESRDYWGNMVMNFNILPAHDVVVLTGHSVVETHRNPFIKGNAPDGFEVARAHLDFLGFDGPVENVPQTHELARQSGLENIANRSSDELFTAAQNLNSLIYEGFTYSPESTDVRTKISQVFASRQGVCQDFAHIFIAACRASGLPARYVSGYLVTKRSRSAEGSPASHAWAEVLLPEYGWRAFDPTNDLMANDYYIKLASGRDYSDVPPTHGVYNGAGVESILRVRVHTVVDEDSIAGAAEASERDALGEDAHHSVAARELVG